MAENGPRVSTTACCAGSAWSFFKSARVLLAEGHPADAVVEMWRPNTDEWALRGRLANIATTLMDGESSAGCAI